MRCWAGSRSRRRTRSPSASATPPAAASRSASDSAAANQIASVPATSGARPETSPPAPRRATSPRCSCRKEIGPRFDTITTGRPATAAKLTVMRVVAAPDKFRGTALASDVASAVARAAKAAGWRATKVPMADGGEGTLDALGGANRRMLVTGPLGDPVQAAWQLRERRAVIEMAQASGLELVGGADGNDPIAASTYGTGELIVAAIDA